MISAKSFVYVSLNSSVVINIVNAPLALVSFILLTVFSYNCLSVAIAITGVPSSIKEIVPCFNSPAGYASECMYDISFNFKDPSMHIL